MSFVTPSLHSVLCNPLTTVCSLEPPHYSLFFGTPSLQFVLWNSSSSCFTCCCFCLTSVFVLIFNFCCFSFLLLRGSVAPIQAFRTVNTKNSAFLSILRKLKVKSHGNPSTAVNCWRLFMENGLRRLHVNCKLICSVRVPPFSSNRLRFGVWIISDLDPLITKFYNKETVLKCGKPFNISKGIRCRQAVN